MKPGNTPRRKDRLGRPRVQKASTARPPRPAGGSLTSALAGARHDPALCVFRHLSRTMRAIAGRYDRALQTWGLTGSQFSLLMTLARQGPLMVGTLADQLGTDPSTIPRLLRPLVAQGFVAVRVGEDRRARVVSISASGTRQVAMALRHWDQVQHEILTQVGDARWKAIRGDLEALRQATISPPRKR